MKIAPATAAKTARMREAQRELAGDPHIGERHGIELFEREDADMPDFAAGAREATSCLKARPQPALLQRCANRSRAELGWR